MSAIAEARGPRLIRRFKVVRLLGQGGMGAVYEAEDLEFGGHVALKTVRPETATNPRAIERFKQEIYLARKVTHPNVCRIFDLFHHRVGSADGEIMFVTMELLRGETLADRLRRVGRMSAPDFVPLVTQMAQGLHAAHQVGIVHRDFKPSNVVLVPVKEQSDDVLARALVAQATSTDAQAAIDRAVNSARATQDQIVRVDVATTAARVMAASRNAQAIAKSIESLTTLVADVAKTGSITLRLEASQALGELEKVGGSPSAGLARISAVHKDATQKGFGLIARHATAAMR